MPGLVGETSSDPLDWLWEKEEKEEEEEEGGGRRGGVGRARGFCQQSTPFSLTQSHISIIKASERKD